MTNPTAAQTRDLMLAIIEQAQKDITKPYRIKKKDIEDALCFILDELCECYCMEVGRDYSALKRQAMEYIGGE